MKSDLITRDNYESWFLDYLDGNLDENRIDEFLQFISQNPDLEEELQLFDPAGTVLSEINFSDKRKLYKEMLDIPVVFDQTAVGFMEGDLNRIEMLSFEQYLEKHPSKTAEFSLFTHTRLAPDLSVIFRNKKMLYRHPFIGEFFAMSLKIAAVILICITIVPFFENGPAFTPSEKFLTILSPGDNRGNASGDVTEITKSHSAPLPKGKNSSGEKRKQGAGKISGNDATFASSTVQSSHDPEFVRTDYPPLISNPEMSGSIAIAAGEPGLMLPAYTPETFTVSETAYVSLSDRLLKSAGISDLKVGRVIKWGLTLATDLTKDKFNYSTDASGEIIALNLDTRLVGFSIPVSRK